MTFQRGINSKYKSRDFLKRGLKSMFPNYGDTEEITPSASGKPGPPHPTTDYSSQPSNTIDSV